MLHATGARTDGDAPAFEQGKQLAGLMARVNLSASDGTEPLHIGRGHAMLTRCQDAMIETRRVGHGPSRTMGGPGQVTPREKSIALLKFRFRPVSSGAVRLGVRLVLC